MGTATHERSPLTLSAAEATALAGAAGAAGLPGVPAVTTDDVVGAARRALAERGVLVHGDVVSPRYADLVRACLEPDVRWAVHRRTRTGARSVAVCARGDVTAALHATAPGAYELTPLRSGGPAAVVAAAGLAERPRSPDRTVVWIAQSTFEGLLDEALDGTAADAGLGPALAGALRRLLAVVRVRVVRRHAGRQAAADLAWVDAGDAGLWGTQPRLRQGGEGSAHQAVVGVAPTDRDTIAAALERFAA